MSDESLVRRDQLPLPVHYIAPCTPTETKLAAIWASVLSMDCVGIEDRYFDLGGDSFLATVIFSLIEKEFDMEIPMSILAEAYTVAALAAEIDSLQAKA